MWRDLVYLRHVVSAFDKSWTKPQLLCFAVLGLDKCDNMWFNRCTHVVQYAVHRVYD